MNNNYLDELLRVFIKMLYDDISYYIIDYIIKNEKAEEQKLANDLNLSYSQIRQSLYNMEKHGIVVPLIKCLKLVRTIKKEKTSLKRSHNME